MTQPARTHNAHPPRVFVGLTEVAGYYSKLAQGLLGQGCEVTVVFLADPYTYQAADDRLTAPPRVVSWILASAANRRSRAVSLLTSSLGRAVLLVWTLVRCDAYIFATGATFFRGLDLPLLRLLRKKTLAVFNGSDARPPYLSGLAWVGDEAPDLDAIRAWTRTSARHLRRTERHVDAIISHPGYAQLEALPFYSYLAVGMPIPSMPPHFDQPVGSRPTVLHAPTRPLHKGTPRIEAALHQLEAEGVAFDYRVLVGLPNDEVLRALRTSDLVVDEVYGDTLLGGLGAEGAAAGCAVVVSGYAGAVIAATHSCPLPPIRLVDPDELVPELRRLLTDADARHTAGRTLRAFVESHWTPTAVAGRVLAILDGTADPTWMIDPCSVVYVDGWGVSRTVLRRGLADYVGRFGPEALCVDHHPALRAALLELADDGPDT